MPLPSQRNFKIDNTSFKLVKTRPDEIKKELGQILSVNYIINLGNRFLNGQKMPWEMIGGIGGEFLEDLIGEGVEVVTDLLDNAIKDVTAAGKELINGITSHVSGQLFTYLEPLDRMEAIHTVFEVVSQVHHELLSSGDNVLKALKPIMIGTEEYSRLLKIRNDFADLDNKSPLELLNGKVLSKSEFDWFFKTTEGYLKLAISGGQVPSTTLDKLYSIFVEKPLVASGKNLVKNVVLSLDDGVMGLVDMLGDFYSTDDPSKISPMLVNYKRDDDKEQTIRPDPQPIEEVKQHLTLKIVLDTIRYIEEEYHQLLLALRPDEVDRNNRIAADRAIFSSIMQLYKSKTSSLIPKLALNEAKIAEVGKYLNQTFNQHVLNFFLTDDEITIKERWIPSTKDTHGTIHYYETDKLYAELSKSYSENPEYIRQYLVEAGVSLSKLQEYHAKAIRFKSISDIPTKSETFSLFIAPILYTFMETEEERLFELISLCKEAFKDSRIFILTIRKFLYKIKNPVYLNRLTSHIKSVGLNY
jgi:hypothetical protein